MFKGGISIVYGIFMEILAENGKLIYIFVVKEIIGVFEEDLV